MGEQHAFGLAGRARGVKHHTDFAADRLDRLEGTGIFQRLVAAAFVEADSQQSARRKIAACVIVEHGLEAGIAHNVLDSVARQLERDRRGDQPSAHRTKECRQRLEAIERKNADPIPALQPLLDETARDGIAFRIEGAAAQLDRNIPIADVDDRGHVGSGLAIETASQVPRWYRHGISSTTRRASAYSRLSYPTFML